ncbi:FxsB family cyclophane-forming radical SAM/SPASM peptide maturase [Paractinoplanes lichenicola]|uniref:FxsB family radical SAM/SPASM domain protein n=1 Tax=Paractinoplanes lichenicola TaxID=2802976 RepID=A0ABS1VV78_9ACTN|nr:FxsB family cyclophane-forming radical SAM/SPASM peptide maturase [Actinoplanes lichenicola]MBL7258383.1 FxsB family radical SAM/SPASM domain protein [Actinoplanes lichenicola]
MDVSWPDDLDVTALTAHGWAPKNFNQFIVKIHSRCNLACGYCYVYESADQGWRDQPRVMSEAVFATACRQIAEHAGESVSLVFHGGEPLLAGADHLDRLAALATSVVGPGRRLRLGMQTNGLLFDERVAEVCDRRQIRVAVSVDGDEAGHDRHRRFRDGRGSHAEVVRGLRVLRAHPHLYAGLLCTVDLANDPITTYEALVELGPPTVDFLLPHGNWTTPPPGRAEGGPPAYGEWLSLIFDRWFDAPVRETGVRLFDDILALILGGRGTSESVGLLPIRVAVIETDGTIEQVDTLKTAFAGATRMRPAGGGNPFDAAVLEPQIVARQLGKKALCATCRACSIHEICGGGNYTHRFRAGSGFLNPSVYCPDLTFLINHVRARVSGELAKIQPDRRPAGSA